MHLVMTSDCSAGEHGGLLLPRQRVGGGVPGTDQRRLAGQSQAVLQKATVRRRRCCRMQAGERPLHFLPPGNKSGRNVRTRHDSLSLRGFLKVIGRPAARGSDWTSAPAAVDVVPKSLTAVPVWSAGRAIGQLEAMQQ